MHGNVKEPGDVGMSPGKSSLFFLTTYTPWNRIARRYGMTVGKALRVLECPVRS